MPFWDHAANQENLPRRHRHLQENGTGASLPNTEQVSEISWKRINVMERLKRKLSSAILLGIQG